MPNHLISRSSQGLLLVGTGPMARAYANVLKKLRIDFRAVGRVADRAAAFAADIGVETEGGGIGNWLAGNEAPARAIVAVSIEALEQTACALLKAGCPSILLEKPGALDRAGLERIATCAQQSGAKVWIAFNRRYYASVAVVRAMIEEDGGATSAFFDFTELGYRIATLHTDPAIKRRWFYANSLHVVDLAFHLIGAPRSMASLAVGSVEWHKSSAQFGGCGISDRGVPFTYRADWAAPGRWRAEIFTNKRRLILCPLEKIRIQLHDSFEEKSINVDYHLDETFKPGLFRQTEAWLSEDDAISCQISELLGKMGIYEKMSNYMVDAIGIIRYEA